MKSSVFLLLLAVSICIGACQKSKSREALINGKWNVVTDSVYTGVGLNNHLVVYPGKPGDFFEFTQDGKVSMNEYIVLQISTFTVSNDSVTVYSFNGTTPGKGKITASADTLIITTGYVYTPGGVLGRTVRLGR